MEFMKECFRSQTKNYYKIQADRFGTVYIRNLQL